MPRILIIDDEVSFRSMLRVALEQMGHVVSEAADGGAGVQAYITEPADVVVTDLIMPGKEGIETIMDLRRHDPQVKIIAMSGGGRMTTIDYLQIAKRVGAKKILPKPFGYEEIRVAITEILAPDATNPPAS
ncbi:response regulator [Rariglobus hedericola]|uniref:Response regulator n=1 Tax=Rariglobus hedericola TaxID=2597822 RepID=A0A556QNF0_9BACT|nr:response regulator [Rariglobus hedericola]TSJ78180.1 response regulator [Rariglobus hedericola]